MKSSIPRFFMAISILLLGAFSSAQGGLFSSNVEKARDFVKANMVEQAIDTLTKEIAENPANTEAHLELGSIYLRHGNLRQSNERFSGAVNLDPKLSTRVAKIYEDTGIGLLNSGNHSAAMECFAKAVSYQLARKTSITELCMNNGKEQLDKMNIEAAQSCFDMAISLQPSLKPKIVDFLFEKAKGITQNADSGSLEATKIPAIFKCLFRRFLLFSIIPNNYSIRNFVENQFSTKLLASRSVPDLFN